MQGRGIQNLLNRATVITPVVGVRPGLRVGRSKQHRPVRTGTEFEEVDVAMRIGHPIVMPGGMRTEALTRKIQLPRSTLGSFMPWSFVTRSCVVENYKNKM